jgi:hypothetical protein
VKAIIIHSRAFPATSAYGAHMGTCLHYPAYAVAWVDGGSRIEISGDQHPGLEPAELAAKGQSDALPSDPGEGLMLALAAIAALSCAQAEAEYARVADVFMGYVGRALDPEIATILGLPPVSRAERVVTFSQAAALAEQINIACERG